MIVYDDVTFRYPGAAADALVRVAMTAHAGELTLVVGPSGSGKSTLLRAANGLVPHFSGGTFDGRVITGGSDTRATKPRELAGIAGFVAQDPDAGSVASTVEDEVVFVLENLGVEPSLQRKRVEETLDALGIAGLRARRLETLSGGERQRVAIAAVLVAAPQFLLLDEPTSMLDPQSAEEVLQTALRCAHELGIGVVMSEHRLERVLSFADTLVVVDGGHVQAGDPRTLAAIAPVAPPVVRLGRALGWEAAPLSVRDARVHLRGARRHDALPADEAARGEPRVQVRGLRVALGGREVIRGVDLTVAAGETLAIVGRNGAGKTTLLRAVMGLARRASGDVLLDGVRRERVDDAARVAAFVPQQAARMLAMPRAIDEVAATLRARRLDPARAAAVLEAWGLAHVAGRDPHDLSAGEATRLALAASCAHDPGIIFLDEPTRGMDEPSKRWLASTLAERRARGCAVVLVTHDVELVAEAATRVAMMAEGEIVVDGPVREVLGESVMFSSQMNKVFGDRRVATVADALAALGAQSA